MVIQVRSKMSEIRCQKSDVRSQLCPLFSVLCSLFSVLLSSCAGPLGGDPVVEARKAILSADAAMGDWQGSWKLDDESDSGPLVAQVIALGKGGYRANFFEEFDTRTEPIAVLEGQLKDSAVGFAGPGEYDGRELQIKGVIESGKFTGNFQGPDWASSFVMEKAIRLSPTLGAKPPAGAIVLFNGRNFDEWKHIKKRAGTDSVQWKLVKARAMEVAPGTGSIITRKKFTDLALHLEFRTPFMPEARGQGRGNSGVYLQGRYEVQILDSYGLEGRDNECGGIYKVGTPLVNMCAPPTQWQTYDITFLAPRFDSASSKTENGYLTVIHNGVKIHENIEVPNPTVGAPGGNITGPGGIYLQDHGNLLQYRNIWLVELSSTKND